MTDRFLMVVLRRRFEAIIREMINALFKSGRSGVLNTAMDFSCSLTDAKFQSVSVALGLPVHVGAIDLIPRAVAAKHGDTIAEGDCFVNNESYLGNTHCADFTLCVPIYASGKLRFYAIARAHFADMGFPVPSTYHVTAQDCFQEGLSLPCVRIQRDFRDVDEVIDICRYNIRAPEQFYGDYLACLAAVRTGEKRLKELCERYGAEVVEEFVESFQDYAERMTIDAISKLPKGRVERTIRYDSDLPQYPDGIPVTAILDVDPEQGVVTFDLTKNVDNVPLGINLSESTTLASCRMGTLNVLGREIPRCTGAFRRVNVVMREGAIIGKPRHPAATSAATSNVCSAFASHVQALFAELSDGLGSAYGSIGLPGSAPVISGLDPRYGNKPFVNQIIMGYWGGPGVANCDGWLTYGSACSQGMLWQSSVEISEQQQPIIVEQIALRPDSGGAGRFEGGPGILASFLAHVTPVRLVINSAAHDHPPPGVRGGESGAPTRIWKEDANGRRTDLGISVDVTLQPGERLISEGCGGGGYGSPAERDKAAVRERVIEGWLTPGHAERAYGFVNGS
jgi:N-methylhydantoinase B